MSYYDPRADIVFRKIFGEHKNLCISLLNALLPLEGDECIQEIEYMDPDILPELIEGKNSVVDVRCYDKKQRTFIVEMQMYWTESFRMRALLNASKAFSKQTQKGMEFKELHPVYCLCLLNENMPDAKKYPNEYSHIYTLKHHVHDDMIIEGMRFVFIELMKFRTANKAHKKLADLWLTFLTMMEDNKDNTIPEELTKNVEVSAAVDCLTEMSLTQAERVRYEKFWDAVSCERTLLTERYEHGVNDGDKKARVEMATKLKAMGLSPAQISDASGLSIKEIEKL